MHWATKLITAPAVEPFTIAEIKDFLRIDTSNAEPAPAVPTVALAAAGAGNVDNGAHRYRLTFVTAGGETEGGIISGLVSVADKTVDGKVALTAIPLGGSAVTSRKIYRTAAAGSTYLLLATIADNTTTVYTDNIADASLGAAAPAANTPQDPLLSAILKAARQFCEDFQNRAYITQTWELVLDSFPSCDHLLMPKAPLQSVTSIKYLDSAAVEATMAAADYIVDTDSEPGRIMLGHGKSWPSVSLLPAGAVRIRFVCGYGATSASVPEPVRQAMRLLIDHWNENREPVLIGSISKQLDFAVDALLWRDRLFL